MFRQKGATTGCWKLMRKWARFGLGSLWKEGEEEEVVINFSGDTYVDGEKISMINIMVE